MNDFIERPNTDSSLSAMYIFWVQLYDISGVASFPPADLHKPILAVAVRSLPSLSSRCLTEACLSMQLHPVSLTRKGLMKLAYNRTRGSFSNLYLIYSLPEFLYYLSW